MEDNKNLVHLSLDLNTAQGKTLFLALAAVLGGTTVAAPVAKEQAQKAAPAPKAASAPDVAAGTATPTSGASTPKPKAATPAAKPAAKAAAPKPAAKPAEVDFADLDAEAQLDTLKNNVTKHTKKGKSADIKALLSNFGAERVSVLEVEHYSDFNDVLNRYTAGESVEDIFPNVLFRR